MREGSRCAERQEGAALRVESNRRPSIVGGREHHGEEGSGPLQVGGPTTAFEALPAGGWEHWMEAPPQDRDPGRGGWGTEPQPRCAPCFPQDSFPRRRSVRREPQHLLRQPQVSPLASSREDGLREYDVLVDGQLGHRCQQ